MSSLNKLIAILNWGILRRNKYVHVERTLKNLLILKAFIRVGLIKSCSVEERYIVVHYNFSKQSWNNVIKKIKLVSTDARKIYKSRKSLDYLGRRVWGDFLISTSLGLYMYSELLNTPQLSRLSGQVILKVEYCGTGGSAGNINKYI